MRDLARHEVDGPPRRLVVVEDPAARVQPVPRRYERTMKCPYAFATPYGVTARAGVLVCGTSVGSPKISLDDAWYMRVDGSTARTASRSAVTPTAANSAVRTGSCHDIGTNDGDARLYTSCGRARAAPRGARTRRAGRPAAVRRGRGRRRDSRTASRAAARCRRRRTRARAGAPRDTSRPGRRSR